VSDKKLPLLQGVVSGSVSVEVLEGK